MSGRLHRARIDLADWSDRHALTIIGLILAAGILLGWCSYTPTAEIVDASAASTAPETTASRGTTATAPTDPRPVVERSTLVVSGATPATRGTAIQATDTLPPPPTGLNGLPFAPTGLEGCARMEWYRVQAGLPADFDWIGQAESNCRNDVNTWCCYGLYQIHELHIGARSARECDVSEIGDMFGAEPLDRQRNVCMAVLVYNAQGICAWDVVRGC